MPGGVGPLNVDPESLAACACQCDAQSGDLLAAHRSAAIESALSGWVGRSHAALAAAAQRWTPTTTALAARLAEHGEVLRVAALTFAEMDAGHARALS